MNVSRRQFLSSVGLATVAATGRDLRAIAREPRQERSVLAFRASGDRDDTQALQRALAQLTNDGGGVLRLPAGRGLGRDGAYRVSGRDGLALDATGVSILGEGEGRTVVESAGVSPVMAAPQRPAANVRVADLTVRGEGTLMYWNGRYAARGFAFERVTFEVEDGGIANCVHLVHDHQGVTEDFVWIDCTFRGGRRMGVELQNHRHDLVVGDRVARYRRHRFVRPRVLDQGSMGLSFSGAGETIEVVEPYFERVSGALIEGVGCSSLTVRDMRVLVDGLLGTDQLIRCSNRFPSRDIVVDGLTLVSRRGRPTVGRTIVRLDNTRGYRLSRIAAAVVDLSTARKTLEFGINHPSADGQVTDCELSTNSPYIVGSEGCANLRLHGNRFGSTARGEVEAVRTVDTTGPSSTVVGVNRYDFLQARSYKPLVLLGRATGKVELR
ncbi:MAG TPA: hypothetical protein VF637_01885 [Sphingomicrobium sp.]